MRFHHCIVALVVLLLSTSPIRGQQPQATQTDTADIYRQAFAALTIDTETARALNDRVREQGLVPEAAQAAKQNDEAIRLAIKAAAMPQADWRVKLEEGPMAELPHIAEVRRLALVMGFRTRSAAREGRAAEAAQTLAAMLALARHTSDETLLVPELVGIGIEALAVDTGEAILSQLDRPALETLRENIGTLPVQKPIANNIRSEGRITADWAARQQQFPREMFVELLETPLNVLLTLERQWPSQRDAWADGYARLFEDAAKAAELPPAQRHEALRKLMDRTQAYGMLAELLAPSLDRAVEARERADVKLALLRASVEVLIDGEAGLAKHPDPATGQPFAYEPRDDGFVLRSAKEMNGEPMTFVVRRS